MSFADIKHQPHAVRSIQRAFRRDRLHHAYLFHGPDGVGKEKLAAALAQLLLCGRPIDEAAAGDDSEAAGAGVRRCGCGRCDDCRSVLAGTHPDLHIIHRQLNREHPDPSVRKRKGLDIGVDVLRHFVIEKVGKTPMRGRAKLFIVREADRITTPAQNALLKTLEEPAGATVIVLLVTSLDRLLPTTLSRCQIVRFDALPTEFVRRKLGALRPKLPNESLDWCSRYAEGSVGRALQTSDDNLFAVNAGLTAGFASLASGDRKTAPNLTSWTDTSKALGTIYGKRDPEITPTEATRRGLQAVFQLAATWYADLLRCAAGEPERMVNVQAKTSLASMAEGADRSDVIRAINRLAEAEHHLDLNANTQLVVETLLNDLARLGTGSAAAGV